MAVVVKVLPLAWFGIFPSPIRADDLVWFQGQALSAQARAVLAELQAVETYGLDSVRYRDGITAADLQRVLTSSDLEVRERFDVALSNAVARFLTDLRYGRVGPDAAGFNLPKMPATFDAEFAARELASAADVRAAITSYEPTALPYRRLKQGLAQYRELALRNDSAPLPAPTRRSLREGDSYDGVAQLRKVLRTFGDLEQGTCEEAQPAVLDACLTQALRRFQKRHGLIEDGILGPRTLDALNVPLERRVRQIELTMERWRWTSTLQKPDIVINVPQFVLYALPRTQHGESSVLEIRVIVGKVGPQMQTPVFADEIEYLIFQPYWDVPASITRRELLPLIRRDASYLARNDMEIVRGSSETARPIAPTPEVLEKLAAGELRLQQRPGAKNALGSIKFILPNPHNVYLHATPNIELFEQATRAFSHGCIRVSEPALLAEYVLKSSSGEWNLESIQAALCDPKTRRVDLATPIPVLIFYGTAVVTSADGIMFFDDIYGHDRRLDELLRSDSAKPRAKSSDVHGFRESSTKTMAQ